MYNLRNIRSNAIIPAMIKEIQKAWGVYQAATSQDPHVLLIVQGPPNCNRDCSYCDVKRRWNPELASTVEETCDQIKAENQNGHIVLNYLGGETLATCARIGEIISGRYLRMSCLRGNLVCRSAEDPANPIVRAKEEPFRTKEGLTFVEHATQVIAFASRIGMITSITTNADFLTPANYYILPRFKKAGLDLMVLSGHSEKKAGFKDLIAKGRAIANEGIVPIFSRVVTARRVADLPLYSSTCTANGIFLSACVVQEKGEHSKVPVKSQVPTPEQLQELFKILLEQKRKGYFVRNNEYYLTEVPKNAGEGKIWKCNPEKDPFIHVRAVGAKGEVGVCSEVDTGFDTSVDFKSSDFRRAKEKAVENCSGCSYSCFMEAENPEIRGDLRALIPVFLTKLGFAPLARWWGRRMVGKDKIIDVPEGELEKEQTEWKKYFGLSLRNRVGEAVLRPVYAAGNFANLALILSYVVLDGARHGVGPKKSLDEFLDTSMVWTALDSLKSNDAV